MNKLLIIISLLLFFSCNKSPKIETSLSEREVWEIKGKWRVQLEKFREVEKLPTDNIEIIQMDHETYFNWQAISELQKKSVN